MILGSVKQASLGLHKLLVPVTNGNCEYEFWKKLFRALYTACGTMRSEVPLSMTVCPKLDSPLTTEVPATSIANKSMV